MEGWKGKVWQDGLDRILVRFFFSFFLFLSFFFVHVLLFCYVLRAEHFEFLFILPIPNLYCLLFFFSNSFLLFSFFLHSILSTFFALLVSPYLTYA
ncbi:hypothetical protein L873DRAFT_1398260 [Choiromyces venosus 120613-1]|uniref:Transmembrane protein n=1 Tax=Choiromyces venosus 120613-1 TaxID=1336337 RepID=A0A3N4J966_9PEZI|nr:hypothetical protein L873DRAFT_1398260 [Choiromyces venosus 120613-1]